MRIINDSGLTVKVAIEKLIHRAVFNPYKVGSIYGKHMKRCEIRVLGLNRSTGEVTYTYTLLNNKAQNLSEENTFTDHWQDLVESGYIKDKGKLI